ncbi:MAG: tripartite tricarboxylate transporter permease [Halanaerobium sp.]
MDVFSINNSIFDIRVMMVLGVIGYLMQKINIPMGPIVLALILGPMAESNFRRALIMSRGSFTIFLTRPISLALITFSLFSLIGAFYRQNRESREIE